MHVYFMRCLSASLIPGIAPPWTNHEDAECSFHFKYAVPIRISVKNDNNHNADFVLYKRKNFTRQKSTDIAKNSLKGILTNVNC